jgi:hypothetical protein
MKMKKTKTTQFVALATMVSILGISLSSCDYQVYDNNHHRPVYHEQVYYPQPPVVYQQRYPVYTDRVIITKPRNGGGQCQNEHREKVGDYNNQQGNHYGNNSNYGNGNNGGGNNNGGYSNNNSGNRSNGGRNTNGNYGNAGGNSNGNSNAGNNAGGGNRQNGGNANANNNDYSNNNSGNSTVVGFPTYARRSRGPR